MSSASALDQPEQRHNKRRRSCLAAGGGLSPRLSLPAATGCMPKSPHCGEDKRSGSRRWRSTCALATRRA